MKYTRCSSIWTGFTTALSCSQETTVIVTAAIHWGFDSELRPCGLTPPLNLPALGRRQPPYVVFTTLRRPVFLVNSRLGHFSATSSSRREATLLPKLRVHFAEFLNESSHKRLRILTPPTCVGLRYGLIACRAEREFSWQLGSATFFRFNPYFRPLLYPCVARICLSHGI